MKLSIIMIDGGFRENAFGPEYFTRQDFPENDFEVIWVDYYDKPHPDVLSNPKVNVITLNRTGIYHSSYCFNKGIQESNGEVIIIPDADQIVKPDFLSRVWNIHSKYDKLVVYGYRYDEFRKGSLTSFDFDELEKKCIQKNTINYGGCLTVRKKWLLEINGYEQHPLFNSGYHANGLDIYTRLKNIGLAIQWEPKLKLYHPWHTYTLMPNKAYESQKKLIEWRKKNMQWQSFQGIDPLENFTPPENLDHLLKSELSRLKKESVPNITKPLKNQIILLKNALLNLRRAFL